MYKVYVYIIYTDDVYSCIYSRMHLYVYTGAV